MLKRSLFLLLAAFAGPARALQPLGEFFAAAQAHSAEYREAALLTVQRQAETQASCAKLLPAVTLSGAYTRNQYRAALTFDPAGGELVIQPYDGLSASAQLSVPLLDASAWASVAAAGHARDAASHAAEASLAEAQRQVARAYYQLLDAEAQRQAYERARQTAERNLSLTRARHAEGVATELDVARASAEVESAERSSVDQALIAALARRALSTLSGLTPCAGVQGVEAALDEEGPLDRWEREASEHSSTLAAASERRQASEQQASAARLALVPVISAAFTEQLTNTPGFVGHSSSFALGASFSWRADVSVALQARAAGIAAERAALSEQRAREQTLDAEHEAWQRVHTGLALCRAARAQAAATALAARLASDRYAAGAGTQLELVQAQRDEAAAEAARIHADAELLYARVALRLTAGLPPTP